MNPRQLSRELREGESANLTRRRWIVGLSLVGAAMGGIVSLYQTGIISRLPDLPLPYFDATRVDASDYAYKRLQTPDGLMMVSSYAVTAWLAGAGGQRRDQHVPALPIAMALKIVLDTAVALELAREEWNENHAFCAYCQLATLASLASVACAAPEALSAIRALGGNGQTAPVHILPRA